MIGNCENCKYYKTLNLYGLCDTCFDQDLALLKSVLDYLNDTGKKTIEEIMKVKPVSPQRIYMWIKQGRLNPKLLKHICPNCGKEMQAKFCECDKISYKPYNHTSISQFQNERFHCPSRRDRKIKDYWKNHSIIKKMKSNKLWLMSS